MISRENPSVAVAVGCNRWVSLRCPDCKSTTSEPKDERGNVPQDTDKIKCPTCGADYMRFFWITVNEAQANKADIDSRSP